MRRYGFLGEVSNPVCGFLGVAEARVWNRRGNPPVVAPNADR